MQVEKGCVVQSLSGRDKGRFFAVLSVQDGTAVIADGKVRRLERPKRKNLRHLSPTRVMLDAGGLATNKQLKLALREYNTPKAAGASIKGR